MVIRFIYPVFRSPVSCLHYKQNQKNSVINTTLRTPKHMLRSNLPLNPRDNHYVNLVLIKQND